MFECMDCHSWMDRGYVIEYSNGNYECPKCGHRSLVFHEKAESCCGQAYEMTVEARSERFLGMLEEILTLEVAA